MQFGTWLCEDGRVQVVCRVETAPATPFGAELQWRWWSPLLDGPEELRAALSAAVQARQRRFGASPTAPRPHGCDQRLLTPSGARVAARTAQARAVSLRQYSRHQWTDTLEGIDFVDRLVIGRNEAMRTLALLAFLGCAAVAQAQQPKTYSPETAPRANEETVLNARVVSVDPAGARLTVRGVDVKADGGRDETFSVAAPATSRLGELKRGMEVLLMLRGTTVVDVKVSTASGGQSGTAVQGTRHCRRDHAQPRAPRRCRAHAGRRWHCRSEYGRCRTKCGSDSVDDRRRAGKRGRAHERSGRHHPHGIARAGQPRRAHGQPASRRARPAAGARTTTTPQAAVTPRPTVTPEPAVAPEPVAPAGTVSPQPVPGGPVTGAAGGRIVPGPITPGPITPGVVTPGTVGGGVVITSTPSPAAYGTPFPTPRPQPTPDPGRHAAAGWRLRPRSSFPRSRRPHLRPHRRRRRRPRLRRRRGSTAGSASASACRDMSK